MSDGIPYADIVILALIAGFILLRLRSVLGQNPENDNLELFKKQPPKPLDQEPIIQVDEKSLKPKPRSDTDAYLSAITDSAMLETINDIKTRDPGFTATAFLGGAKMAFEMVFDAFAKGDKATLKMLLSDAIYNDFVAEIDKRAASENKTETTLVSVQARDITHISLDKNLARLTVHFVSEQVTIVRDPQGTVIEGNASEVHHVENDWVFERDVTSRNPNWKIIET